MRSGVILAWTCRSTILTELLADGLLGSCAKSRHLGVGMSVNHSDRTACSRLTSAQQLYDTTIEKLRGPGRDVVSDGILTKED